MKQIKTVAQLKKELKDGDYHEFFISLAGGLCRSSKDICMVLETGD